MIAMLLIAASQGLKSQGTAKASPVVQSFRVLSANQVLVLRDPPLAAPAASETSKPIGQLYSLFIGDQCANLQALSGGWSYLEFKSQVFGSEGQVYILRAKPPAAGCATVKLECAKGADSCASIDILQIDTTLKANGKVDARSPQYFAVYSPIAYDWPANPATINASYKENEENCRNKVFTGPNSCRPDVVGKFVLDLRGMKPTDKNAFASVPPNTLEAGTAGAKTGVSLVKAIVPTKENASFYANFNVSAATGSAFAWGLDGKLDRSIQYRALVFHYLYATADGGHNTGSITGANFTDTVDWMLPIAYTPLNVRKYLSAIVVQPKYETDFELDKENFLGWGYPSFQIWNNTQEEKLAQLPASDESAANFVSTKQGRYGQEFDVNVGIEGGGALENTVQKPSKGSAAPVLIPAYSILRQTTQLHGVFEVWRFNMTDAFTGRYLFLTENSATQTEKYIVYPNRVSGWKGVNKLSISYKEGTSSHLGVSLTYCDGFDAPKFTHTNSVQAGLQIIY